MTTSMNSDEDFKRWEKEGLVSSTDPDYDYLWMRSPMALLGWTLIVFGAIVLLSVVVLLVAR